MPAQTAIVFLVLAAACGLPLLEGGSGPESGGEPQYVPEPEVLILLMALAVALILIGVGIAVGLALLVLILVLFGFGVISFSAAYGALRRSTSSAFRAFFLLVGGIAGAACGIALFALASWLLARTIHYGAVFAGGSLAGLIAGVAVAAAFNYVWTRVLDWAMRRWGSRKSGPPEKALSP